MPTINSFNINASNKNNILFKVPAALVEDFKNNVYLNNFSDKIIGV